MKFKVEDFLRCPESSCNDSNVALDYYFDGENILLSFRCINCENGSLEDDLRWYVKCPNCMSEEVKTGVDRIEYNIENDGKVSFKCMKCNSKASDYIRTRWDNSNRSPKFETLDYKKS
jgi:DNA-directed RNA polymerase subunit RPC12/RpoP